MRRGEGVTQSARILEAIKAGCLTSREVSDFTGMAVKTCTAYMTTLRRMGLIRQTGRVMHHVSVNGRRVQRSFCYEVQGDHS